MKKLRYWIEGLGAPICCCTILEWSRFQGILDLRTYSHNIFKATTPTPFSISHLAPLCPLQNGHKSLPWVLMRLISGTFVGTDNKRELLFPWGNWENNCEWGDDDNHLAINIMPTGRKAETKEGRKWDWNLAIVFEFIHTATYDSLILKCLV